MSRKRADFRSSLKAILAAHQVSDAEWQVLDMVRLRIPLPPDELLRFMVRYLDSFPDIRHTAADYRGATDALVERGLLYVLGFADAVSPAPPYSTWDDDEIDGLEGKLDFTPAGFALMQEVSAAYEAQYRRPLLRTKPQQHNG